MTAILPDKRQRRPVNPSFAKGVLLALLTAFASCHSPAERGPAPDEHHFKKVVLAEGLPQPVMLDMDDHDRIYIAESGGSVVIFDQATGQFRKAGFVPTYDGNEFG